MPGADFASNCASAHLVAAGLCPNPWEKLKLPPSPHTLTKESYVGKKQEIVINDGKKQWLISYGWETALDRVTGMEFNMTTCIEVRNV